MNRQTALIFYILSVYVVVQFIWWGYHLIELTAAVTDKTDLVSKRITMVFGEGAVFLLILLLGLWQIRRSIKKQLNLNQGQRNFMLSITHELKTPLAANKLYLQTIAKRDPEPSQRQELLDKAIEENRRLEKMIDKILNATRLENNTLELAREKFDLSELINRSVQRFISFNPTQKIKVDTETPLMINADKFLIESVVNNLLENAIKYGEGKEITIYGKTVDQCIIFGVKDLGSGVPKEDKTEIFNKFYRRGDEDTRTSKGTGLGLYIVKQIVSLHGGSVVCYDNVPVGADFQIKLKYD